MKVSIIIPNYNYGQYLPEAIESIVSQGIYKDIEIIIIDDCSTDDSRAVIETIIKGMNNVKRIFNTQNRGTAYSRNIGIQMAKGEYVLMLDSDDKSKNLWKMVDILDRNPNVDMVYGDVQWFGDKQAIIKEGGFNIEKLKESNYIGNQMLIRKSVFDKVKYDEMIRYSEDDDFLYSCIDAGFKFYYIPEITLLYRKHSSSKMKSKEYPTRQEMKSKEYPTRQEMNKIMRDRHPKLFLNKIPEVSVVMTNYNFGCFITEAIESIEIQGQQDNVEIIVVDDCSTDNSIKALEELSTKYSNIKVIRNEQNMGTAYAQNVGIKNSLGKYIWLTASDDRMFCLWDMVGVFRTKPEVDIIYGDVKYFGDRSAIYTSNREFDIERLKKSIYLGIIFVRKEVFDKAGMFDESMRWSEDDDFIYTCIEKGLKFYHIPKVNWHKRIHNQSKMNAGHYPKRWDWKSKVMKKHTQLFSEQELVEFYWEERGKDYVVGGVRGGGGSGKNLPENLSGELHNIKFDSLLEVGCAYGRQLKRLKEFFPEKRIVGVDGSSEMIRGAQEEVKGLGIELYKESAQKLHFKDKEFDVVCTFALFMHIPESSIEQAIKEVMRVGKIGRFQETDGGFSDEEVYQFPHNYERLFLELGFCWKLEKVEGPTKVFLVRGGL